MTHKSMYHMIHRMMHNMIHNSIYHMIHKIIKKFDEIFLGLMKLFHDSSNFFMIHVIFL